MLCLWGNLPNTRRNESLNPKSEPVSWVYHIMTDYSKGKQLDNFPNQCFCLKFFKLLLWKKDNFFMLVKVVSHKKSTSVFNGYISYCLEETILKLKKKKASKHIEKKKKKEISIESWLHCRPQSSEISPVSLISSLPFLFWLFTFFIRFSEKILFIFSYVNLSRVSVS